MFWKGYKVYAEGFHTVLTLLWLSENLSVDGQLQIWAGSAKAASTVHKQEWKCKINIFTLYWSYSAWEAEFCPVIFLNEIPVFTSNSSGTQSSPI